MLPRLACCADTPPSHRVCATSVPMLGRLPAFVRTQLHLPLERVNASVSTLNDHLARKSADEQQSLSADEARTPTRPHGHDPSDATPLMRPRGRDTTLPRRHRRDPAARRPFVPAPTTVVFACPCHPAARCSRMPPRRSCSRHYASALAPRLSSTCSCFAEGLQKSAAGESRRGCGIASSKMGASARHSAVSRPGELSVEARATGSTPTSDPNTGCKACWPFLYCVLIFS